MDTSNAHTPARFLIFALPRTGGTLLSQLLDSHPGVHCDYELFNPNWPSPTAHAHLARCVKPYASLSYGFKFQLGNVRDVSDPFSHNFVTELMESGWKMLYLQRRNVLRQALSLILAQQHKAWHKSERKAQSLVYVDCSQLLETTRHLEVRQVLHHQIASRHSHLALLYENDLLVTDRHQPTADRCFDFLGIPPAPVQARLARISTDRLADFVENHAEIIAAVSGTKYRQYLPGVS